MQDKSDAQLLRDYAEGGREPAFREIVTRHTDLVYSAALRQVGSPDLACDLTQGVFTDLARKAPPLAEKLADDSSLVGWLYRSTRFAALKHLRDDRRRLAHERQAMEQLITNSETAPDWDHLRPVLDETMSDLNDEDREALLLRFFKNCDFHAIGQSLGVSDAAAQKRVSRALDKLRGLLSRRGITTSAAALSVVLTANAVQAAPVGLAVTISTAAALGGTTLASTTTATATKVIAMTTLQKTIVTATVAILAGTAIYHARQALTLRRDAQTLQQEQAPLTEELAQLKAENERLSNLVTRAATAPAVTNTPPLELLRLRGEVGRLRREIADAAASKTNAPSALSAITSNPDMWKFIRNQNKVSLGAVYKEFAKRVNLPKEQADKLADLLADNVMDNVDQITAVLRDGMSPSQMQDVFAAQEAALLEKVQTLLGADNFAQYQDYTRDLGSQLTAEQFKAKLAGDKATKEQKTKQLYQLLQEETRRALANASLSADFQTVPMLNFRNLASETEAEKSLKLLDDIYGQVTVRASAFLTPDEVAKFEEFRKKAMDGNRVQLTVNRKMMSPGSK